jgi:hypothetical protein
MLKYTECMYGNWIMIALDYEFIVILFLYLDSEEIKDFEFWYLLDKDMSDCYNKLLGYYAWLYVHLYKIHTYMWVYKVVY